ncbi:hypothetical protein [Sphingopyxis sp.]|uniref:hypothetical protein n=1 Tax=Sphingopyxis sp. TaxID=1908224 RepID=UPI0010F5706F|nr:hypothetical protein [Sphingopyxis sp.]MBR2170708.1 hypothetical protein [Sphingopyxis sp.]
MISAILSLALAATSPTVAANSPAKPAKPKKVCEKVEVTGSTVPKRVCRTVAEPAKPKDEATQAVVAQPAGGSTN